MIRIKCDVVVVGFGLGGGVVVFVLVKVGLKVIVMEKGSYYIELDYFFFEGYGMEKLYENGGIFLSIDGCFMILVGVIVGGGFVVNWFVCIKMFKLVF